MPRNKRINTKAPFTAALDAANQRLAKAIEERAQCQSKLAMLNGEIPSLERTIVALGGHLDAKVKPSQSILMDISRSMEQTPPLWQEPDMTGVGVIPEVKLGEAPPLPQLGKDEDWK